MSRPHLVQERLVEYDNVTHGQINDMCALHGYLN